MCHQHRDAPISGGGGITETDGEAPGADRALPAFLARPDNDAAAPAVLIVHDIWGANAFYRDLARRLAGEGFVALLPDFFARQGELPEQTRDAAFARRERLDSDLALRDIAAALDWLREHPASSGRVATIGFCMGGTLVLLAASRQSAPDATVAFYGFPAAGSPSPLDEADTLRSPLLAFWGDADTGVGMDNVETYRAALTETGARHEFVIYPDYPHGFLSFDPDSTTFEGSRDAWERMLTFFKKHLK